MRELAGEDLPLNLAISLHAPNEPLRKQLIPWAEHFALRRHPRRRPLLLRPTGREITLEYILLSGVNDRPEHARELAKLCKTLRANVNLIRYNEVAGLPYQPAEVRRRRHASRTSCGTTASTPTSARAAAATSTPRAGSSGGSSSRGERGSRS